MKKIYYLSSCNTCVRIINSLPIDGTFDLQDIKVTPLSLDQLEELYNLTGSYSKLLNKRARLYQQRNLKDKSLSEADIKNLLLEHYTFLKRPVFIIKGTTFIGNSKSTIDALKTALNAK